MTDVSPLFQSLTLGKLTLPNRIVMAPLTRNRAAAGNVPGPLAPLYYAQRASVGLIISEATQISPLGQGYIATPGIHSAEQVVGWRRVTNAVHAAGGRMFAQLWHVGRISHSSLLPDEQPPVAPSAIRAASKTFTAQGFVDVSEPRALTLEEIAQVVADYRRAAANAIDAGFDGVEVHAANGYLIDQFLRDGTNRRTDRYGGSRANRAGKPFISWPAYAVFGNGNWLSDPLPSPTNYAWLTYKPIRGLEPPLAKPPRRSIGRHPIF